jgi:hypothetical protein
MNYKLTKTYMVYICKSIPYQDHHTRKYMTWDCQTYMNNNSNYFPWNITLDAAITHLTMISNIL